MNSKFRAVTWNATTNINPANMAASKARSAWSI